MSEVIIGVDLGGTQIRAALLDRNLKLLERHKMLTLAHEGLEPTLQRIKDAIRKVYPTDGRTVLGIGISAPGPLNPETGVVVAPPNLHGWHNVPLGDILHEAFGVPVFVGNDANVAALAETARGAAQGYRHAIFITVSTGIGSGIVYDGRLILGKDGLAAEVGHIPLLIGDNHVSTLEKEAAGPSLARKARERIQAGESSLLSELSHGDLNSIDAKMIGEALAQGDTLAQDLVNYCGKCVGLGVVTLLHLFNPEIIVMGGGVSKIGEPLFNVIDMTVRTYSLDPAYWQDLKIVRAALAGDVSIVGAAALVLTQGGQADLTKVVSILNERYESADEDEE